MRVNVAKNKVMVWGDGEGRTVFDVEIQRKQMKQAHEFEGVRRAYRMRH